MDESIQKHLSEPLTAIGVLLLVAARVLQMDSAYLYRLKNGIKNDPGVIILRRLGLERVVRYRRTK